MTLLAPERPAVARLALTDPTYSLYWETRNTEAKADRLRQALRVSIESFSQIMPYFAYNLKVETGETPTFDETIHYAWACLAARAQ